MDKKYFIGMVNAYEDLRQQVVKLQQDFARDTHGLPAYMVKREYYRAMWQLAWIMIRPRIWPARKKVLLVLAAIGGLSFVW